MPTCLVQQRVRRGEPTCPNGTRHLQAEPHRAIERCGRATNEGVDRVPCDEAVGELDSELGPRHRDDLERCGRS